MDVAVGRHDGNNLSGWVLIAGGLSTFREISIFSDQAACRGQGAGMPLWDQGYFSYSVYLSRIVILEAGTHFSLADPYLKST